MTTKWQSPYSSNLFTKTGIRRPSHADQKPTDQIVSQLVHE
jgi:hypothetical protein